MQMICRANQLTGFYMMATLAFNELSTLLTETDFTFRFWQIIIKDQHISHVFMVFEI